VSWLPVMLAVSTRPEEQRLAGALRWTLLAALPLGMAG